VSDSERLRQREEENELEGSLGRAPPPSRRGKFTRRHHLIIMKQMSAAERKGQAAAKAAPLHIRLQMLTHATGCNFVVAAWPHMSELPSLVSSSNAAPRAYSARKWAVLGAAFIFLCVTTAMFHASAGPFSLRSKHALIPDPGISGPLYPSGIAMENVAPGKP
jgi:hypothetical protein